MAKVTETKSPGDVAPDTDHLVLGIVDHDGVRYAPGSDRSAIPADAITPEQLAALVAAGIVAA